MIEISTIIQAVFYILSKIGSTDKLKLIKLIFLADKYHLINYGRTITNDSYLAMEYGPVGSVVKDVLSFNAISLSKHELDYASTLFEEADRHTFRVKPSISTDELDMLSETDI
ncbi:hypothetical protein MBAV_002070, partial [Candidatus Magnetobacterium bavaricum]